MTFLDFDKAAKLVKDARRLAEEVVRRGLPELWLMEKLRDTDTHDFNEAYDNIFGDGECTWCEYEFSGDGTNSWLKMRCEFHKQKGD